MINKRDNSDADAKLAVREYMLRRYHNSPLRVIDCCAGERFLWSELRKKFSVDRYWPIDIKGTKGALKCDSAMVLEKGPIGYDVIDVDTYGMPWKHWLLICERISDPTTVFLTVGLVGVAGASIGRTALDAIGVGSLVPHITPGLQRKLCEFCVEYMLGMAYNFNREIVECVVSYNARKTARYFGIRLGARTWERSH